MKSDSKDIYNVTKVFYVLLNFLFKESWFFLSWCPTKTLGSTTVFNIDNNKKVNKINKKDHVTLKTGVMDAVNSALPSQKNITI